MEQQLAVEEQLISTGQVTNGGGEDMRTPEAHKLQNN
jgi:hypothetical protein